jgi:protein tyrosine/serine phosphatase
MCAMRYQPFLLALVLVFAPACSKTPTKHETPTRPATPGMPIENFAKVADGVYRGAQPDAAGFKALKGLGVKTIVSLRNKHDDAPEAKPLGLDVVRIPMDAKVTIAPPTEVEIKAFLDAVLDPARRPVFVHCAKGKDRTGTMCAVYRIEVDHWAPQKAYDEMKEFGWHDEMYPEVGKFVLGYKPHLVAGRAGR